eukprot:CAMPEP_0198286370 /NCGR_PEP_ID=MMETSP1449-20131203/5469_1 /TAXON_ID=420275 /ORGANISM="Attheya septentrionalis, Strain CCMP2084" /LENGTH=473 /DNA_ID=CAMNT_0043984087 /DNA_START=165 /DNA_END=1586 /DNA_ORIENTATION=+
MTTMMEMEAYEATNHMTNDGDENITATRKKRSSSLSQKKSSSLPSETVEYLKAWMMSPEHVSHPYPTEQEKTKIMDATGIELKQLTNWFVNNRKRYWKPRVEARLQQRVPSMNMNTVTVTPVSVLSQVRNSTAQLPVPESMSMVAPTTPRSTDIEITLTRPSTVSPTHLIPPYSAKKAMLFPSQEKSNRVSFGSSSDMDWSHHQSSLHQICEESSSSSETSDINSMSQEDDDDDNDNCVGNDESTVVSFGSKEIAAPSATTRLSGEEVDERTGLVMRREVIDVNILHPLGSEDKTNLPTLKDVTILPNVPQERILRSFQNCDLCFSFPAHLTDAPKKIQSRRDAEVVRVKQHFLSIHVNDVKSVLTSAAGGEKAPIVPSPKKRSLETFDLCSSPVPTTTTPIEQEGPVTKLKRTKLCSKKLEVNIIKPDDCRPASYHCHSTQNWRDACSEARSRFDRSLPTLEEASLMFGYSQ